MHLCSLFVIVLCLEKVLPADLHQSHAAYNRFHTAPSMAVLYVALVHTATVLEMIAPTVEAMMPDKAPLVIGVCAGCNALALRFSFGGSTAVLSEQVGS